MGKTYRQFFATGKPVGHEIHERSVRTSAKPAKRERHHRDRRNAMRLIAGMMKEAI